MLTPRVFHANARMPLKLTRPPFPAAIAPFRGMLLPAAPIVVAVLWIRQHSRTPALLQDGVALGG